MDLFTYLMSKKGYNYLPHKDLFSYLLGKKNSTPKTATGTEITINSIKKQFVSLKFTKESTQDGTPTPDNPVDINVVKGYRNLFDKDNANIFKGYIVSTAGDDRFNSSTNWSSVYIPIESGKTYTVTKVKSVAFRLATSKNVPTGNGALTNKTINNSATKLTITAGANDNYLTVSGYNANSDTLTEQQILDSIMIVEGSTELPYVSYGNNYITLKISDGNTTNNYPIPLNDNELAGIGTYKDELIVDKNGKVYLNKKTSKIVLDGSENWSSRQNEDIAYISINNAKGYNTLTLSNYFLYTDITNNNWGYFKFETSNKNLIFYNIYTQFTNVDNFKNWLSTHNTKVYYVLETFTLIDLNTTVDIKLFKGANTITNTEDCTMTIEYY